MPLSNIKMLQYLNEHKQYCHYSLYLLTTVLYKSEPLIPVIVLPQGELFKIINRVTYRYLVLENNLVPT
jgi:hypothetical protein